MLWFSIIVFITNKNKITFIQRPLRNHPLHRIKLSKLSHLKPFVWNTFRRPISLNSKRIRPKCKVLSTTWKIVMGPTRICYFFLAKGSRQGPHDEGSIPESSIVTREHVDPRFHFLLLHNREEREGRPI